MCVPSCHGPHASSSSPETAGSSPFYLCPSSPDDLIAARQQTGRHQHHFVKIHPRRSRRLRPDGAFGPRLSAPLGSCPLQVNDTSWSGTKVAERLHTSDVCPRKTALGSKPRGLFQYHIYRDTNVLTANANLPHNARPPAFALLLLYQAVPVQVSYNEL